MAMTELLAAAGRHGGLLGAWRRGKVQLLHGLLADPPPAARRRTCRLSPRPRREVLEVFRTIARAKQTFGKDACGKYLISMTESASDLLEVMVFAKEAGLFRHLDEGGYAPDSSRCRCLRRLTICMRPRRLCAGYSAIRCPRRAGRARQSGNHAGIFRQQQGRRHDYGQLGAADRAQGINPHGRQVRHQGEIFPRPRRRARARRHAAEPEYPGATASNDRRRHQNYGTRRSALLPLLHERHRLPKPGAGDLGAAVSARSAARDRRGKRTSRNGKAMDEDFRGQR